jgi:hypothetical protein
VIERDFFAIRQCQMDGGALTGVIGPTARATSRSAGFPGCKPSRSAIHASFIASATVRNRTVLGPAGITFDSGDYPSAPQRCALSSGWDGKVVAKRYVTYTATV